MSRSFAKNDVVTTENRTYVVASPAAAGAAKITVKELKGDRVGSRFFRLATSEIVGHYDGFVSDMEANRVRAMENAGRMPMTAVEPKPAPMVAPTAEYAPVTVPDGFRFRLVARDGSRRPVQARMF